MKSLNDWIANLLQYPGLTSMGHGQRAEDANLGLGWLYYGLARTLRPATVVVVGSYRGFVPLVFGKALMDNLEGGSVCFIDPSLVDDFWRNPQAVAEHFQRFGATNVRHHLLTTQQFVESEAYRSLGPVTIVFVDGYHTAEQARFDYEAFQDCLTPEGIVLFHDSVRIRTSRIYGPDRAYEHGVKRFIDELKLDPKVQAFDLPCFDGLTLVRQAEATGKERRA